MAAIVFDFDGTLADSLPGLRHSLNRVLAELDRSPVSAEAVRGMIGEGVEMLLRRALLATGPLPPDEATLLARFLDHYKHDALHLTRTYPGADALLRSLGHSLGHSLGLCTNKPQVPTLALLQQFGWTSCFGAIFGGDAVPHHKPDPAHLRAVLQALDTDHGVLIGDSPADATTAQAAGLPLILVRHGYSRVPVDTLGADEVVDDLLGVPGALDRLGF